MEQGVKRATFLGGAGAPPSKGLSFFLPARYTQCYIDWRIITKSRERMATEQPIKNIEHFCREFYRRLDFAHNESHGERVVANALALWERTGGDRQLIVAGAWVHQFHDNLPELAAGLEMLGLPSPLKLRLYAIAESCRPHKISTQADLEARIVFDADALDLIGPSGTVRELLCNAVQRELSWEQAVAKCREVQQLFGSKLCTAAAREIAHRSISINQQFWQTYDEEKIRGLKTAERQPASSAASVAYAIRELLASDACEYGRLHLEALTTNPEAFAGTAEDFAKKPSEELAEEIRTWQSSGGFALGGFSPEGKLAGMIGVGRASLAKLAHRGHVWGVYVTPAARGTGLGRRLLFEVIQRASRTDGLVQLDIEVVTKNAKAYALYEQAGFVPVGLQPAALQVEGRFLDEHLLVLRLPERAR